MSIFASTNCHKQYGPKPAFLLGLFSFSIPILNSVMTAYYAESKVENECDKPDVLCDPNHTTGTLSLSENYQSWAYEMGGMYAFITLMLSIVIDTGTSLTVRGCKRSNNAYAAERLQTVTNKGFQTIQFAFSIIIAGTLISLKYTRLLANYLRTSQNGVRDDGIQLYKNSTATTQAMNSLADEIQTDTFYLSLIIIFSMTALAVIAMCVAKPKAHSQQPVEGAEMRLMAEPNTGNADADHESGSGEEIDLTPASEAANPAQLA